MLWRMLFATGFLAVAMALAPLGASALSPGAPPSAGQTDNLVVGVSDYDDDDDDDDAAAGGAIIFGLAYCAIQQQVCAKRYDEDSWRFARCMRRRGC